MSKTKLLLTALLLAIIALMFRAACVSGQEKEQKQKDKAAQDALHDSQVKERAYLDSMSAIEEAKENESLYSKYVTGYTKDMTTFDIAKKMMPLFRKKNDEFQHTTWIIPKEAPLHTNENGIYVYFGAQSDETANTDLRLRVQYHADDWLFIKKVLFQIDGEDFEYVPDKVNHDNSTDIWEWSDEAVKDALGAGAIVHHLQNAKTVKMRFLGSKYWKDRSMTAAELTGVKKTLALYKAMGGAGY